MVEHEPDLELNAREYVCRRTDCNLIHWSGATEACDRT